MTRVPSVRRPSSASLPCCFAVPLSIGASGEPAAPPSIPWACQMKSCSRLPSFLVSMSIFALSTTSRTSATRPRPSSERRFDGCDKARDLRKEFKATSICSFWKDYQHPDSVLIGLLAHTEGTLPLENARRRQSLAFESHLPLVAWRSVTDATQQLARLPTYLGRFRRAGASERCPDPFGARWWVC